MLDFEEQALLSEWRKTFRRPYKSKVVDMDERLGGKLQSFIIRLEKLLPETGLQIPPYRQSRFSIIYVKKGQGQKTIGNVPVAIRDRTLMIIPSRVISSSLYSNMEIQGYYLSINLNCFLQNPFLLNQILNMNLFHPSLNPYLYADSRQGKVLEDILESILNEVHQYKKNREFLIAGKVLELAIHLDRMCKLLERPLQPSYSPLVVQFISLLHDHFKIQHSVRYYASQLHVHPNSLNAAIKQYLGQSAKATIDTKLVSESQYLLQQTTLSVKEIAYELGFKSASHFFRFFKRHTGEAPLVYRRKHLIL